MNNHCHIYKYLKGTKLGGILDDSWLRQHKEYKEYYLSMYLRERWGKLPALLSREGIILFSGGRATASNLVKQRLKSFNEAFDEMHKKNSDFVIGDKDLRKKTSQVIIKTTVPVYRSYMQNYCPLIEQDHSASKYAKCNAQSLEKVLGSLFHHKPMKHGRSKMRQVSGKLNNGIADQYPIQSPRQAIE